MAENSFRPLKGKWLMKEFTLKSTAGDVEKGDLISFTSSGNQVMLATSGAESVIGIAAENIDNTTTTSTLRIKVPAEPKAEMIGSVGAGVIAVGETDSGRNCDANDHEGAAVDTNTHHHLYIVRGTVAGTSSGEAVFRIAQTPEMESWDGN